MFFCIRCLAKSELLQSCGLLSGWEGGQDRGVNSVVGGSSVFGTTRGQQVNDSVAACIEGRFGRRPIPRGNLESGGGFKRLEL